MRVPMSSPGELLSQSSARFSALNARSTPDTEPWLAFPDDGVVAQRIPLPALAVPVPFAERAMEPPGIPMGGSTAPTANAGVVKPVPV